MNTATVAAFDTSFEARLAKIDLSRVMEKLAEETGMDAADLSAAEDLYRKFLTLKAAHFNVDLVPPVIVDHVWDMHVQFTRQYMADCEILFGQYLHHTPHVETDGFDAETPFLATQALYKQRFGIDFTRSGLRPEYVRAARCM